MIYRIKGILEKYNGDTEIIRNRNSDGTLSDPWIVARWEVIDLQKGIQLYEAICGEIATETDRGPELAITVTTTNRPVSLRLAFHPPDTQEVPMTNVHVCPFYKACDTNGG